MRVVKHLLEKGADVRVDKTYEDDEGKWRIKGNCLVLSTLLDQKFVIIVHVVHRIAKSRHAVVCHVV